MLEHLGEKLILHVSVGSFSFSFDLLAIIMSWIVIIVLVVVALILRRGLGQDIEEKPSRTQAILESLIDLLKGQLTSSFSSDRLARELFPFVSTIFMFVLVSNWLSVIPYCESPTKDLNVTLSLALLVFVMSQLLAVRMRGGIRYLKGFLEPYPFMLPLNIVSEIAKPISHSFRLFGNTFGGAILVTVVSAKFAPVLVPAGLNAFYGLFIGAIQAFVFALLTVAYINVAVES
ncbi:MAG: F0F1 ATP synthase subunit A [Candidatus Bipolaricaulota bacterium]